MREPAHTQPVCLLAQADKIGRDAEENLQDKVCVYKKKGAVAEIANGDSGSTSGIIGRIRS